MAAGRLIASDCTVLVSTGGAVTPSGPSWPGGAPFASMGNVTAYLKRANLSEGTKEVDVSANGDTVDKYRPQRLNFEVEIEMLLDASRTRPVTAGCNGFYVAVSFLAYSGYSLPQKFVGFISKRGNDSNDGDAQSEKFTLKGGVDGYNYTVINGIDGYY